MTIGGSEAVLLMLHGRETLPVIILISSLDMTLLITWVICFFFLSFLKCSYLFSF